MSRDFLSSRVRTRTIIGSNNPDDATKPQLEFYSDEYATNHIGGKNGDLSTDLSNVTNFSSSSFIYVHGMPHTGSEVGPTLSRTKEATMFIEGNSVVRGTLWASVVRNMDGEIISSNPATVTDNTTSVGNLYSLDVENLAIVTSPGTNSASLSGIIGDAEDNDYTDGLFTDFNNKTLIGTAIDRFNEVLKELAPKEAPSLQSFDVNTSQSTHSNIRLSFGSSNDQSAATPAYATVQNLNEPFTRESDNIDINEEFNKETLSLSYRLGVYDGTQDFIGDLNTNISSSEYSNNIINYTSQSFGKADQGELRLFLNGTKIHTLDLSTFESGDSTNGNSGFINVSSANSGRFLTDSEFATFKHRTGQWKVAAADQRNGWNYAQVRHVIGEVTSSTGFAEWVNDSNTDQMSISNAFNLHMSGSKYLSGVQYHMSGSVTYTSDIDNFYKYTYKTGSINFTTSNSSVLSLDSFNIPDMTLHTDQINLVQSGSFILDNNRLLNKDIAVGYQLSHHFKDNIELVDTNIEKTGILVDNFSVTSTDLFTGFDDEEDRLFDTNSYTDANITSNNYDWDSSESLSGDSLGYNNGLIVYNSKLMSPKNSSLPNSGNFSTLSSSHAGNPNYSLINDDIRTFIKKIKNTSGNTVNEMLLTISGSESQILDSETLTNSQINIELKLPETAARTETQWMSIAADFNSGSYFDGLNQNTACGDSTVNGLDLNISGTLSNLFATFGNEDILNNDHVLLKITAPGNWSGSLDNLTASFENVIDSDSLEIPEDLSTINSEQSGESGKLSFGATNTIVGVTNYTTDINTIFNATGNKIGIFDGNNEVSGTLNYDVVANANNYPDDSFGNGNIGTLKLEINGDPLKTIEVDLAETPFVVGDSLNPNGSGFIDLTSPQPTRDSNNRPKFDEMWRKAKFKVSTQDQRPGYNYAIARHVVDGVTTHSTNMIEWIVDTDASTLNFTNNGQGPTRDLDESSISSTETNSLSGISYYKKITTLPYEIIVNNVYKNVYSRAADAVTVFDTQNRVKIKSILLTGVNNTNITNSGIADLDGTSNIGTKSLPSLISQGDESERLKISSNIEVNYLKSILDLDNVDNYDGMNTVTIYTKIKHPIKNSEGLTTSGNDEVVTSKKFLQYNVSQDVQSETVEDFSNETQRVLDNILLDTQGAVTGSSWNSSSALVDGLMVYDSKLRYPDGNFKDINDVGSSGLIYAPSGNPTYVNTTGNKVYIRKFRNNTSDSKFGFDLSIQGNGTTLVDPDGSLSETNIKISVKLPETSESQSTGYMNIAKPFETGEYGDNAGSLNGTLTSSITSGQTTTNSVTLGQKFASPNDYIILKIEANQNWSGYINNIEVSWS